MIDHVANMRALLNHHDPSIAARGREMVKASRDPAVRALLNNSPAERVGAVHGPRAARGAKAISAAGDRVASGGGKIARSASPGSRFAHWAKVGFAGAAPPAAPSTLQPAAQDAAAFVLNAARKARGQPPISLAEPTLAVPQGNCTPKQAAAFVAAAAAKARGVRPRADEDEDTTETDKLREQVQQLRDRLDDVEDRIDDVEDDDDKEDDSPEAVAAFVARSAAKARGQR